MKVTIESNEEKEQEITFPCLMGAYSLSGELEFIILATKIEYDYEIIHGTVVQVSNSIHPLGKHTKGWNSRLFQPLPKGTKVILEN